MAGLHMDYSQSHITTLHDIAASKGPMLKRVEELSRERSAALVIPLLFSELENAAIGSIIDSLNKTNYLSNVIVSLTASDREQYRQTVKFFKRLSRPHMVIWVESPHLQEVLLSLRDRGMNFDKYSGKGIAIWTALGIASIGNYAIAVHDGDIDSYDEMISAKLLYPLIDPELDYFFSKGFYARISNNKLYGRVCRLLLWPLLDSLIAMHKQTDLLQYMRSFSYPLAGEFAITSDLAQNIRIPTDWGLEVGILAEVYRSAALKRICQVDLGFYSHKHRAVGASKQEGLLKTAHDIITTLLRVTTESDGTLFTSDSMLALSVMYRRRAQDYIRKYFSDSKFNQLQYERHEEEALVDAFAPIIMEAWSTYSGDPTSEQIPDWLRVISAMPSVKGKLLETTRGSVKLKQRLFDAAMADFAEVK